MRPGEAHTLVPWHQAAIQTLRCGDNHKTKEMKP
jgi:hypothetical protein